jgi:hypothetical protein
MRAFSRFLAVRAARFPYGVKYLYRARFFETSSAG